eukprot:346061-Rhodomonas_salina.1
MSGGSRGSGGKLKSEWTLLAWAVEDKWELVGNNLKTSQKATGIGGSSADFIDLTLALIYTQEPDKRWYRHPRFRPPFPNSTHPNSCIKFSQWLSSSESGGATIVLRNTVAREHDPQVWSQLRGPSKLSTMVGSLQTALRRSVMGLALLALLVLLPHCQDVPGKGCDDRVEAPMHLSLHPGQGRHQLLLPQGQREQDVQEGTV